ncbi:MULTISPECIES: helix-turn-helix domain-containing protein [Streptomyces]|uniref:helix-turn-helix domain-containing protein n=1 Tax=Streptomyces TaxID=1883 RepID=UPI002F94DC08
MARWKELPAALDSRERRLVAELRRLKDHSGLSLAALAAKTAYSRSSWERYLNGKQPVPREAVEQLARVCGTDPTRLAVLHDVAVRARQPAGGAAAAKDPEEQEDGPAQEAAAAPPDAAPPQGAGDGGGQPVARPARTVALGWFLAGVAAAAAAAFTAGLLAGGAWSDGGKAAEAAQTADAAAGGKPGYRRGVAYRCEVKREGAELRAGHGTSRTILLDTNSTGFDVVEVQCLLREHGFDPGSTEGLYDQATKDAATRFQKARGLVADGIVGPKTWGELRK